MNAIKNVLIIQARVGSTRLPGKVLMKVLDKPIIQWMVERMLSSKYIHEIMIATTPNSSEIMRWFYDYVKNSNFIGKKLSMFVGPEDDVIRRMCLASAEAKADVIVDVTSDCPLCDPMQIDDILSIISPHHKRFYLCNIEPRLWPDGFDFQIYDPLLLFETEATMPEKSPAKKFREHSGWNILQRYKSNNNKEKIRFFNLFPQCNWHCAPKMRLTLDYQEDFESLSRIISHFVNTQRHLNQRAEEIINFVIDNPHILKNRHLEDQRIPVLDIHELARLKNQ
jgi:spore coat polysaccharide biosynthesis protein SpsF